MTGRKLTAAELLRRLNSDPEWVAAQQKKEIARQALEAEYRRVEAPLLHDLERAGYKICSVWEFVNSTTQYIDAIPILFNHLQKSYPGPVREGIARALAVPAAKFGRDTLIRLFRDEQEKRPKDALAVAIANTSDDDDIDEVISLAKDRAFGSSRKLLLSALERSKIPNIREVLVELGADPVLRVEVRNILNRLGRRNRE